MRLRPILIEFAAFFFYVVATIAMTWPLAANLSTAVPDHGDAYGSVLMMRWDARALTTDAALFELPIFHPTRHALAFSEHLIGVAAPLLPFYLAGAEPLFVHNVGLLFGFALSGYGAYVLGRVATGARAGAIVAGLFFAFLPFRFNHIAHIHFVTGGWFALLLAAWLYWTQKPTRGRAALFGAAFFVNAAVCLHAMVLAAFAIALAAPVALAFHAQLRNVRAWIGLTIATAIAGLALVPMLRPYVEVRRLYGLERSIDDTLRYSAQGRDWLTPPLRTTYAALVNDGSTDPERWLFPGLVPLFIVLASAAARSRRGLLMAAAIALLTLAYFRAAAVVPLRLDLVSRAYDFSGSWWIPFVAAALFAIAALRYRWSAAAAAVTAAVWIVAGFVLSLGPATPLFRFLFAYVSPLRGIRVPARWAMIVFVGMAILIAFAVGKRFAIAAICAVVLLAEAWAPNRFVHAASTTQTTRWLAGAQFEGGVFELPFRKEGSEYRYLLAAATHMRPILNGISSYVPSDRDALERLDDTLVPTLRRMNASLVVVHRDRLGERAADVDRWLATSGLTRIRRFCRDDVFAFHAAPFEESCDAPVTDVLSPTPGADMRGALRIEVRSNAKAVSARIGSGRLIVPLVNRGGMWSAVVAKRPESVDRDTDIQIEADGVRLEGAFLTWRRATELRWYDWRSPATWEIAQRLGAPQQLGRELLNSHSPANVLARATLRAGRGLDDAGFRDFAISALIGRRVDLQIDATDRESIVFAILESDAFGRANLKM